MRFLLLGLLLGCGGAAQTQGTVFLESDHTLFDDSSDLISDPTSLEGQWRDEWSASLDGRIRTADVIGYAVLRTIRTDVDLEQRTTLRLVPETERALLGEFPEDLVLSVVETEPGFSAVQSHERTLLGKRFILFLRYELTETGTVTRWHVSPAEPEVAERVEYLLERRRGVSRSDRGRVFVHEN